jgi:hypothetical protein
MGMYNQAMQDSPIPSTFEGGSQIICHPTYMSWKQVVLKRLEATHRQGK